MLSLLLQLSWCCLSIYFEEFQNQVPAMLRRVLHTVGDNSGSESIVVKHNDVSPLYRRETSAAKHLCIYDPSYKLLHHSEYDIGGTYTDNEPDLWFYFTTSYCPGNKCLLNLFVCIRKAGSFEIGVSKSSEIIHTASSGTMPGRSYLAYDYKWQLFKSSQPDEKHFIKSYCILAHHLANRTLCIPIIIKTNPAFQYNVDLVKQVKLNHDFGDLLSKQEKTNFVIQSASGKQYQVHKIILAAHSPILRSMVKSDTVSSLFLDISDNDMELLLQFLYTGTIRDILKQNCINLLDIADKFKLTNLFFLVQFAIAEQIDVTNCMTMAVISERYRLEKLQSTVFEFIKSHPKIFETDGWKKLEDVNLTKKMLEYFHASPPNVDVKYQEW